MCALFVLYAQTYKYTNRQVHMISSVREHVHSTISTHAGIRGAGVQPLRKPLHKCDVTDVV